MAKVLHLKLHGAGRKTKGAGGARQGGQVHATGRDRETLTQRDDVGLQAVGVGYHGQAGKAALGGLGLA